MKVQLPLNKRKTKIAFLVLFSWFSVHELVIISDGLTDEKAKSNIAVIFGTTVNEDGTLSLRLKARLDKGIELYKDSVVSRLFVSGGYGKEGHYEADKMAAYLISQHVPPKLITIDNEGNNTQLTANNFIKIFPKTKTVILVSQFYHISRAKLAFKKVGISTVYGVHCEYYELKDIYSCFREFFAYYKYLVIN